MINTYLKTHNITRSCKIAGVSINTFRLWYARYLQDGFEGIKKHRSHINKKLGKIEEKYKKEVIMLKKNNPGWGRRTIASVVSLKNGGKKVISPSGVQIVLKKANLWFGKI